MFSLKPFQTVEEGWSVDKVLVHSQCDKEEIEKLESGELKFSALYPLQSEEDEKKSTDELHKLLSNRDWRVEEAVTSDVASRLLNLNTQSVRALFRNGKLKGKKIGRLILIDRQSIYAYTAATASMKKNDPRRKYYSKEKKG